MTGRVRRSTFAAVLLAAAIAVAIVGSGASSAAENREVRFERTGLLDVWRVELPGRLEASRVRCASANSAPLNCELLVLVRSFRQRPTKVEGARADRPRPIERTVYALALSPEKADPEIADRDNATWRLVGRLPDLLPERSASPSQIELVETADHQAAALVVVAGRVFLGLVEDEAALAARGLVEVGPALATASAVELGHRGGRPWSGWSVIDPVGPLLAAFDVGVVDVFDLAQGSSVGSRRYSLPVSVERKSGRLVLSSPPVRVVGSPPRLAVGPEAHGQLRLRTLFLDPFLGPFRVPTASPEGDGGPDPEPVERWSRLPGPERVVESAVWWIDSLPVLAVVTLRADKVGIFERKKLRLFELESDRTLAGSRPAFETLTASRMWQALGGDLVDADGDGDLDLVLVQPDGFGGDKLAVDVYPGSGTVRFAAKAVRSMVPVAESWWRYGDDWTGDRVPDLVCLSSGVLRLFSGRAALKKGFLGPSATVEHTLASPTRDTGGDSERDSEEEPDQQASVDQGVVVVRSRYSKGPDLLEVVRPVRGARSLSRGSIASEGFD